MGGADEPGLLTARAAVRGTCDAHLDGGAGVVVAVSGGPDSVALVHLLAGARPDLEIVVAHVRHGLRDDQADHDAAQHAAREIGAQFLSVDATVGAGEGPEDAARQARYAALWKVVDQVGASALVVGHTMDDQAETVLLRIARGTGLDGLAGMAVADARPQGLLLRPLLGLRREVVRAQVADQPTVEDPTNTDPEQRRSRARHEVLPALSRLHPSEADVVPLLARLAGLARDEVALIDRVLPQPGFGRMGSARTVPAHSDTTGEPALRRRALRQAWDDLDGDRQALSRAVVDAILAMDAGDARDVAGGVRVTRSASCWTLDPAPDLVIATRTLGVPGQVDIPELDARLTAERIEPGSPLAPAADLPWVDGDLVVSFRGPDGARDARKLLSGVPLGQRHLTPIIRDQRGRVLGTVPGPLAGVGCDVPRIRLRLRALR